MSRIIPINDYLKKEDNSPFFIELVKKINELYKEEEAYNTTNDNVSKKEFDKIMAKGLNNAWLNDKLEFEYIKNIKEYFSNSEEPETILFDVIIDTCLTDIFKDKFLNVSSKIRKSIVQALSSENVSYSNYYKYGLLFLDQKIVEILENINADTLSIFRLFIDDLNLDKDYSRLIDDMMEYIDNLDLEEEYDGLFKEYTIDEIHDVIDEQIYLLDEIFRSSDSNDLNRNLLVGIFDKELFDENMKHLLRLKHLNEEKKKEFLNIIKDIDNKYDTLIDKTRLILNMIDIYYKILINVNYEIIDGKRKR